MPELPEVEAVRRRLEPVMRGASIERVLLRRKDLRRPFPPGFASRIEGRRIRAVERRGKYLLVRLASGDTLLMHLGMSGSFRVARATRGRAVATEGRHDHVVFELSNGAIVVFNDPRRFGVMDVIGADAAAGDDDRGFAGWTNRRFDAVRRAYGRALGATLRYRPVVLTVWVIVAALIVPFYLFSQQELAPYEDQGFFFGFVQASANSTLDQTKLFADQIYGVYHALPESRSIFQITTPGGGVSGMTTKPWSERSKTTQQLLMESMATASKIPGIRVIPQAPPPLPGGGNFPVDLVIASAAEPQQLTAFADSLVKKAFASGLFIFADADVKFDQPQTEIVFDRDKLQSQGVDLSQAGRDLSALLGANYVNRFSIDGRSYKVIPQVARVERLTADQLSQIYVTGSQNKLVPLSTFASLRTTTEPRELKKFQQLNAVRIQGVIPPPVPLDKALSFLETEARAILPQGFTLDYAGESRQLRNEGSKFLGTFVLSAVLIYLVLAAQFESFRDPFIVLAGSVPLAVSGALLFSFLGATTLNIYSQVGLITLVGLITKHGILIVEFANQLRAKGESMVEAVTDAAGVARRRCGDAGA
jgi:multidrug efflux pump